MDKKPIPPPSTLKQTFTIGGVIVVIIWLGFLFYQFNRPYTQYKIDVMFIDGEKKSFSIECQNTPYLHGGRTGNCVSCGSNTIACDVKYMKITSTKLNE